jgi:precorrin-2 dehydrogenase / sirohydrochlorin ferrochelatase
MSGFGYPVTLALTARPCLVVGGGAVAERKVEGFVDAGARVTVVSPWLSRTLLDLAADGRFAWWPREYAVGDARGFFLAIVATDDRAVNREIASEARVLGVLVHCADDPALSDFTVASSMPSVPLAVAASATAPSALPPR